MNVSCYMKPLAPNRKRFLELYAELDEERNTASTTANEAMSMIQSLSSLLRRRWSMISMSFWLWKIWFIRGSRLFRLSLVNLRLTSIEG
ncbi:hypothetical protein Bca4012_068249 [Brassica carinata]